jgi:hypothetical protein
MGSCRQELHFVKVLHHNSISSTTSTYSCPGHRFASHGLPCLLSSVQVLGDVLGSPSCAALTFGLYKYQLIGLLVLFHFLVTYLSADHPLMEVSQCQQIASFATSHSMLTQYTTKQEDVESFTILWAQVLGSGRVEQAYSVFLVGVYLFNASSLDVEALGSLEVCWQL